MNNFKIDGWQPRHWRDIEDYSKDLARCAADLNSGIDSGSPSSPVACVSYRTIIEGST